MEKALKRKNFKLYYFDENGNKVEGIHSGVRGDISRVCGDITGVSGDISEVCGDISEVYGDISGVCGNITGVSGDIDDCKITETDRKKGININDLIKED